MKNQVTEFAKHEQLINWWRAFLAGALSASLMMAFMDIFTMMGITRFSYEAYLGSLILHSTSDTHIFTSGVLANWILGGVFGFFYAFFFESVFRKAGVRIGIVCGLCHAALAAVAFFPFFNMLHEFANVEIYPRFGFFGFALGPATPILLLLSHLLFGLMMGAFYGPVRVERIRAQFSEPGEWGMPSDREIITPEEDPEDRVAV